MDVVAVSNRLVFVFWKTMATKRFASILRKKKTRLSFLHHYGRLLKGTKKVKVEEFNQLVEAVFDRCRGTLCKKAEEYAQDHDRLHNFKQAAALKQESSVKALGGMLAKHTISIYDLINAFDPEKPYDPELWREKITDHVNYLVLLEALLLDQ